MLHGFAYRGVGSLVGGRLLLIVILAAMGVEGDGFQTAALLKVLAQEPASVVIGGAIRAHRERASCGSYGTCERLER